ncbi:MAG TPA: hypothetical protein PLS26_12925 [Bacteroidales bacterium]|jgi:hypothetical protein|nr:hypothetical protein [Bacteroidales bacterium]HPI31416.1 hypothetical protein [Bacteroidales bacterium]
MKKREFAVCRRNNITPASYTWDYCVQNKLPYIIVYPKIKFCDISYDLLSQNKGLAFEKEHEFLDRWLKIYNDYVKRNNFPRLRIKHIGGRLHVIFTIFKKDREEILDLLFDEIEKHIKKYGYTDEKLSEHYRKIEKFNNRMRR